MTEAAWNGPIISAGVVGSPDNNGDRGPSVFDQAWMLMDPRAAYAYQGQKWRGWLSAGEYTTIDQIPGAVNATVLAAIQSGSSALTLASASAGVVSIGNSVVNINTGQTVTGLIGIDVGGGSSLAYGQSANGSIWNPAGAIARNVTITNGATMSAGIVFTVAGFDLYGAPMTEAITASGSGSVTLGAKAFKYISTITPSTLVNGAVAGVGSLCGLPIRADNLVYLNLSNAATAVTAFTAAVTATATATTGDVRGTFLIAGIDATSRTIVFQRISAANISTQSGVVGVTQA